MNSAGGVGVFVRPHQLAVTSTIACAAEFGSSLLPLSHIPPPRFGYFCAKSNNANPFFEPTVGRTLHSF